MGDKEKQNFVGNKHQFLIEAQKLTHIQNISSKTNNLVEIFGSTKDLIIIAKNKKNKEYFNYTNFDNYNKEDYLFMQNYILKICKDQIDYNNNNLNTNNFDLLS